MMAGMTVLLVMSLFAVITMSAQDDAGAESPGPGPPAPGCSGARQAARGHR
jgi:hypothetical protein